MSEIQILKMLQEGTITPDEADRLLKAVEPDAETVRATIQDALPADGAIAHPADGAIAPRADGTVVLPATPLLVKRFRQIFLGLFGLSFVAALFCAYGMVVLYQNADRQITWKFAGVLLAFVLSDLFSLFMLWLWRARWLHVRIRQQDGNRFMISLPLPLTLTEWGLRIARRFVDEDVSQYLDMGSALTHAIRDSRSTKSEPISIEVGDENEQVQVYIG